MMFDTPFHLLVVLFQENRFFWAAEDEDTKQVECQFCLERDDRPESLNHKNGCIILAAIQMIASDEAAVKRIKDAPPRRMLRGSAELTVIKRQKIFDLGRHRN